ncbi:MAG: hydrogenase small subunit [Acidimicrobiaceae bacterium]|nr:hydrogenase small subunit [Acidimicrobiaceae bacterium]
MRAADALPGFDLRGVLARNKLSRRRFLQWSAGITAALGLPSVFTPQVAEAAELLGRVPVIWIEGQSCTGNTEAFLRASAPTVSELILQSLALQYHETVMAGAGFQAEETLASAAKQYAGKYVLVIEGSIPTGANGGYATNGASAQKFVDRVASLSANAAAVIAAGSCASFGGIPAASPNPTGATRVSDVVSGVPVINIPACPMNPDNFVGTILHFVLTGQWPATDSLLRPTWAFGTLIHNSCPRRAHFDAGEYVQNWGDEAAQSNFCLYKMGCKGPYTYNNCPSIGYNENTSWPIRAGHGCIGCSQPAFWDQLAFERPLATQIPGPGIFGLGLQSSVDKFGAGLVAVAGVGVAVHAVASGIARSKSRRSESGGDDDSETSVEP